MSVGIYTHYARCDEAYLALRLAEFLRGVDEPFELFSDTPPARLGSGYDSRIKHRGKVKFTEWARTKRVILWTGVPAIEQLNYAKRHGIKTIVAPMWQELELPFRRSLRAADVVVSFSMECRELYRNIYKFKNSTLIPFDPGIPASKKEKPVDHKKIKIFLPWFDRNARCTHVEFIAEMEVLLRAMPEIHLTVGISSSKFSPAVGKFLRSLGEKTGRVNLLRNVAFLARPEIYAQNDLTIFPAECDNYGFCGLTSIACGTPIVSFGVSPQTDFIYPSSNGVLVKAQIDYDENGVPHANPDYSRFFEAVQALVAEPKYIETMNARVNYNLSARKKAFELGWHELFGLV
jgi:glycosyltransferase involved in cell wall biosynthesis